MEEAAQKSGISTLRSLQNSARVTSDLMQRLQLVPLGAWGGTRWPPEVTPKRGACDSVELCFTEIASCPCDSKPTARWHAVRECVMWVS